MTDPAPPVFIADRSRFAPRYGYSQGPRPMGRTLRPLFPSQDFSDLDALITDHTVAPPLSFNVAGVKQGFLLIEAGSDGVVFTEDGQPLQETTHFSSKGYLRYDLATLRAQARTVNEHAVVGIDPGWRNYYHWLMTVIGRMALYGRLFDDRLRVIVADFRHRAATSRQAPRFSEAVWRQTLDAAGLSPRILPLKDGVYRFRRLDVAWLGHRQVAYLACLAPFTIAMRAIRCGIGETGKPTGRYILVRAGDGRVGDTAWQALEALRDRHGFTFVQPEALDFHRQCELFGNAATLVAPHGAGLTNLLMGNPRMKVVELNMHIKADRCIRPWFYLIADACGQDYAYLNMSTTPMDADALRGLIRAYADGPCGAS